MRILVTGASGFVGTHLLQALQASPNFDSIIATDRREPLKTRGEIRFSSHDLRTKFPDSLGGNFDCIVNLAAVHKSPGHPAHEYFETNILGAKNVCDLARRTKAKTIIFTSSISVYGPGEDEKNEDCIQMPNIPYGSSKAIAEYIHREWMLEDPARKLRIIRPAVVFGKGEGGNFTRIASAMRKGIFVYPGRKDTIKSWVYVKDLCRLILWLIDRPDRFLLYNCCYPKKTTTQDICAAFSVTLKYRPPRGVLPLSLLKSGASILKVIDTPFIRSLGLDHQRILKLVHSTNVSSEKVVKDGFKFEYDLEKALTDWAGDCGGNFLN